MKHTARRPRRALQERGSDSEMNARPNATDKQATNARIHRSLAEFVREHESERLADLALRRAIRALPPRLPSSGFSERVLRSVQPPWPLRVATSWGLRAALLVCLTQLGLLAAFLFAGLPDWVTGSQVGLVASGEAAGQTLSFALRESLDAVLGLTVLLDPIRVLAQAAVQVFQSPGALLVGLGCAAVLAIGLYTLARRLPDRRTKLHTQDRGGIGA